MGQYSREEFEDKSIITGGAACPLHPPAGEGLRGPALPCTHPRQGLPPLGTPLWLVGFDEIYVSAAANSLRSNKRRRPLVWWRLGEEGRPKVDGDSSQLCCDVAW